MANQDSWRLARASSGPSLPRATGLHLARAAQHQTAALSDPLFDMKGELRLLASGRHASHIHLQDMMLHFWRGARIGCRRQFRLVGI
jgi:hypothetical protein